MALATEGPSLDVIRSVLYVCALLWHDEHYQLNECEQRSVSRKTSLLAGCPGSRGVRDLGEYDASHWETCRLDGLKLWHAPLIYFRPDLSPDRAGGPGNHHEGAPPKLILLGWGFCLPITALPTTTSVCFRRALEIEEVPEYLTVGLCFWRIGLLCAAGCRVPGCPTHSRFSNEWVPRVTVSGTSHHTRKDLAPIASKHDERSGTLVRRARSSFHNL